MIQTVSPRPKKSTTALNAIRKQLLTALTNARKAGMAANVGEDGGTCNFDSAVLFPEKGVPAPLLLEVAKEAGLDLRPAGRGYWSGGWFVSLPVSTGQGNKNTRVAVAIEKSLSNAGYRTSMYYQMD